MFTIPQLFFSVSASYSTDAFPYALWIELEILIRAIIRAIDRSIKVGCCTAIYLWQSKNKAFWLLLNIKSFDSVPLCFSKILNVCVLFEYKINTRTLYLLCGLPPKKRLNDVQYALTAATQCLQCKIYRLIIHSVSVVLFILSKQFKLCKIEDNTTLG